jgi:hypothetical protein
MDLWTYMSRTAIFAFGTADFLKLSIRRRRCIIGLTTTDI